MTVSTKMLVPGSTWEVTSDLTVYKGRMFLRSEEIIKAVIPIGAELEIVCKLQCFATPEYEEQGFKGAMYEIAIDGNHYCVFYKDLKATVKQLEIPETFFYVIYDTALKQYYKGQDSSETKGSIKYSGFSYGSHYSSAKSSSVYVTYSKTPKSGKKMKDLGKAKQRLLFNIGYFNEMDNAPAMLFNYDPLAVIPDTWEIQEINEITLEVKRTINAVEYVEEARRLGGLTLAYGAAVRDIYSKLEKKNELPDFAGVVVFSPNKNDETLVEWKGNHDGDSTLNLTKDAKDGVNVAFKTLKKSSKEVRKSTKNDSVAIAFKKVSEAMMLKLAYTGGLSTTVIDFEKLEEVVEA